MGQIKNIKLHIVTDIKIFQLLTQHTMSSASLLRGGIRVAASSSALLQSVGVRSSRVSRRHIVSLGLTSVCQVMLKKRALMDANVQPVNKYHLANENSLTSAVQALCDTHALDVSEEERDLITEDEQSENGLLTIVCTQAKWRMQYTSSDTE